MDAYFGGELDKFIKGAFGSGVYWDGAAPCHVWMKSVGTERFRGANIHSRFGTARSRKIDRTEPSHFDAVPRREEGAHLGRGGGDGLRTDEAR